jgi:hypothetical protein
MTILMTNTETGGAFHLPQAHLDVLAERQRQIQKEGWTEAHDDRHSEGEMARAASCYAMGSTMSFEPMEPRRGMFSVINLLWPSEWSWLWWKPGSPRRMLVKAAALLLAEIERIDRAEAREREKSA